MACLGLESLEVAEARLWIGLGGVAWAWLGADGLEMVVPEPEGFQKRAMHAQSANAMIAGPNRGVLLCQGPHYCVELLLHCVGFVPARTFAHRGSWTPAVELRDDALTRLLRPGIAVAIGAPSCHPPQPSTQGSMTGNTATEDALELLFVCVWEEQLATVSRPISKPLLRFRPRDAGVQNTYSP